MTACMKAQLPLARTIVLPLDAAANAPGLAQGPMCLMVTPAQRARHSLSYVVPSAPHTCTPSSSGQVHLGWAQRPSLATDTPPHSACSLLL